LAGNSANRKIIAGKSLKGKSTIAKLDKNLKIIPNKQVLFTSVIGAESIHH